MSMSQKESVFTAVVSVIGEVDGVVNLNKDQRKQVIDCVTDSIQANETDFSTEARAKYTTRELIKGYVNGMVSNWLRKDTRLNGGEKYVTKNPGSRAGSGDEVLKNLKALKATLSDAAHISAVDEEIEKRTTELAQAKAKTVVIDINKIPEELRHLIPSAS